TPELSYKYSTHIQTISGLAPGTTYHFRVISKSASGSQVLSPDSAFTTVSLTSGSSGGTSSSSGSTSSDMICPYEAQWHGERPRVTTNGRIPPMQGSKRLPSGLVAI